MVNTNRVAWWLWTIGFCMAAVLHGQWVGPDGQALEDEPWRKSVGDFRGMLLVAPDPDQFLDEWGKPASPDNPPNLETTDTARRGDETGIFVLFQGCTADARGLCDATVDYQVRFPDGSQKSRLDGADLWIGKPEISVPRIQLGVDYLRVIVEAKHPLGEYAVHARLCDRLADTCFELSTRFEATHRLVDFDLNELFDGYYLDPQPEFVAQAIQTAAQMGATVETGGPFIGFFAEVFARHPEQVAAWRPVIDRLDETPRQVFLQALKESENPHNAVSSLPPSPVKNDQLWGRFFASGDTAYLDGIIAHLALAGDRKDLNLFLTGTSAQWSLASNLRHRAIQAHVRGRLATADEALAAQLQEVLSRDPSEFRTLTMEVINTQKEAGIW